MAPVRHLEFLKCANFHFRVTSSIQAILHISAFGDIVSPVYVYISEDADICLRNIVNGFILFCTEVWYSILLWCSL